jgi:hypothetical protein
MFMAYDYPVLGAFWTIMWIFLWVLWLMMLFRVIADVFRDDGLSGWAKSGWVVFVIVLPLVGVLVYLIARGKDMGSREMKHAREQQRAVDAYIRDTAGTSFTGSADDLARLAELKAKGDISERDFERAKEKILH